jgi:hypothetical protein
MAEDKCDKHLQELICQYPDYFRDEDNMTHFLIHCRHNLCLANVRTKNMEAIADMESILRHHVHLGLKYYDEEQARQKKELEEKINREKEKKQQQQLSSSSKKRTGAYIDDEEDAPLRTIKSSSTKEQKYEGKEDKDAVDEKEEEKSQTKEKEEKEEKYPAPPSSNYFNQRYASIDLSAEQDYNDDNDDDGDDEEDGRNEEKYFSDDEEEEEEGFENERVYDTDDDENTKDDRDERFYETVDDEALPRSIYADERMLQDLINRCEEIRERLDEPISLPRTEKSITEWTRYLADLKLKESQKNSYDNTTQGIILGSNAVELFIEKFRPGIEYEGLAEYVSQHIDACKPEIEEFLEYSEAVSLFQNFPPLGNLGFKLGSMIFKNHCKVVEKKTEKHKQSKEKKTNKQGENHRHHHHHKHKHHRHHHHKRDKDGKKKKNKDVKKEQDKKSKNVISRQVKDKAVEKVFGNSKESQKTKDRLRSQLDDIELEEED